MVNILHVVAVVQQVHELLEHRQIFCADFATGLRMKGDLLNLQFDIRKRLQQCGFRLVELLKQPQYKPMPVEKQVISIYAATKGFMDKVPVANIREFEEKLLEFIEKTHNEFYVTIRDTKGLPDEAKLNTVLQDFADSFLRNVAGDPR